MRRAAPLPLLLALALVAALPRPREAPGTSRPSGTSPISDAPAPFPALERARQAPPPDVEPRRDASAEEEMEDVEETAPPLSLAWLLRRQNKDGGWGDGPATLDGALIGRPGLSGLALLTFLGAGYSHLSKDRSDGLVVGDAVRAGLEALKADQREDGTFRSASGTLDQAVAALALCEAYGLTGSSLTKEAAQKSVRALLALRTQDGAWGDATTTFWAADALNSARLAELKLPEGLFDSLRGRYGHREDGPALIARLWEAKKTDPAIANAAARLAASPPAADQAFYALYLDSRALFAFDGPAGPVWKRWESPMKRALLPRQAADGSWPGGGVSDTIVTTSLATLTLQVYYRYVAEYGLK